MVGGVAILGCDSEGEAWVREKGVDCWGDGAGFLYGEGATLVSLAAKGLLFWKGKLTGGQKSSCMSTTIKAAFILDGVDRMVSR